MASLYLTWTLDGIVTITYNTQQGRNTRSSRTKEKRQKQRKAQPLSEGFYPETTEKNRQMIVWKMIQCDDKLVSSLHPLTPRTIKNMEQWHYFVGDIHGCYDEYKEIEACIHRHAERQKVRPLIVSVGDMIDRGPASASVVRHFRRGTEAGTHAAVMGNHEEFLLVSLWEFAPWGVRLGGLPHGIRTLKQRFESKKGSARVLLWEQYRMFYQYMWITQGGYETLESFQCNPHQPKQWDINAEDLSFLLQLPMYWENKDYVVTHALPKAEHLTYVRQFTPQGEEEADEDWSARLEVYRDACRQLLWRRPPQEEAPDPDRLHISGHTSYNRVKRTKRTKTLQLDTGCIYKQRLTAWCGEDNTFFRAQYRHPPESHP